MSITIDLKTRVFSRDEKAYRLFPGRNYFYFKAMREHSIIFLDHPGFPMPGPSGYEKSDKTLQEIARAEVRSDILRLNSDDLTKDLKKVEAEDFSSARWSKKRELARGQLNALYADLKPGELVIVPSPAVIVKENGEFEEVKTLVGEIVGKTQRWRSEIPGPLGHARFLVRKVRWLTEIKESELDPNVVAILRTQNPLIAIPARSLERSIGAAFKNIVLDEEFLARFTTENFEFTAFENYHFNAFVMALVAAQRQREAPSKDWKKIGSIYEIAAGVHRGDQLIPEQEASIHSPGYMTIRGNLIIPAIVSAMFALALQADAQAVFSEDKISINDIKIINSESDDFDPCELGIEENVRQTLNILGYERWLEMQGACKKANDDDGLSSIAEVAVDEEDENPE